MKIKILLYTAAALLFMSSCTYNVFAPALYHEDIAYQPKPTSFDTLKSASYISAGLNAYADPSYTDMLLSAQVNLSRGHRFENANVSYGLFGVAGDYSRPTDGSSDTQYFTEKFFGAVGARFSANLFTKIDRTDFRFIGMEAAYSHEFGSYADFRRTAPSQPNLYIDPRTDMLTLGLTSEVIFHNRNNNNFQHGIRVFLGGTLGNNSFYSQNFSGGIPVILTTIFPKASYYIKFNHIFGTIEIGKQVFGRLGYAF